MGKRRLRLRTGKGREGDTVERECTACRGREKIDADVVFECWEMDGGPFPVFDCPFCDEGRMVPRQVIEETEDGREKEKHLGRPKRKR